MINLLILLKKIKSQLLSIIGNIRSVFLKNKTFTIISDTCWGGFIYQYFNLPYNSPFIGLYIFSPDYIDLLSNFKKYMNDELTFMHKISLTSSKYHYSDNIKLKYEDGPHILE